MFGIKLGKGNSAMELLLPTLVGAGLGVLLYKMQADKQMTELQGKLRAATVMQAARGGLSDSLYLSYNTTPYFLHNLPTTSEWNPENLQFSGSISDAGNGYTFVIPKSAM